MFALVHRRLTNVFMKISSPIRSALLLVCCACVVPAFAAGTITGRVHNRTTGRPSAGDNVVLLRLQNGMEEEARATTDAQGKFRLNVATSGAERLVRIVHQNVNYDQKANGTSPLDITVFDAAVKVQGVSAGFGIAQIESEGKMLKVTEMYSINNDSNPPVTQSGLRNFEFPLPPQASLSGLQAKTEGGVWVNAAPDLIKGEAQRYSVAFPLRPGHTLFKYVYQLPFHGKAAFHWSLPYPVKRFAVIHSPSLSFKASDPQAFTSPGRVQGLRLEQVVSKDLVREVPSFEISESDAASAPAGEGASSPASSTGSADAAGHPPLPAAPRDSQKEIWALLAAAAALVAAGVFAVRRKQRRSWSSLGSGRAAGKPGVEDLKQELFRLETERLRGSISPKQYDSTREALSAEIQRATETEKG